MDFTLPPEAERSRHEFAAFVDSHIRAHVSEWMAEGQIPCRLFLEMGKAGWLGFTWRDGVPTRRSLLEQALLTRQLAALSPGVAVAVLAHVSLGAEALMLFGSEELKRLYGEAAARGQTLLCLGHTESAAGSDASAIRMRARRAEGGWVLDGAKAFVTGGHAADLAVVTAVTDPAASRSRRTSMFLADLRAPGVSRTRLDKRVWVPSDLTRITFEGVIVPQSHLLGREGQGLQQVLKVFTRSRVLIAALALGTAEGAFELALERAEKRELFGKPIIDFQAKSFEAAHHFARLEAASLALLRACQATDSGESRLESSVAKYLAVEAAREACLWAADLFGAASVIFEHPIHKFPMDAWAASLGEGTQDVQKLVIFRELMRRRHAGKRAR